jgi:hypothetical protein
LMGLPLISLILFDRASPWKNVDLALNLFEYFAMARSCRSGCRP